MKDGQIDVQRLEARVAELDDAALRALCERLAEHLQLVAPVTPQTRRGFALLRQAEEAEPELLDDLEALRDELDDAYFELDAANDEEATIRFQQARAVSALVNGLKVIYADAVYEACFTADQPAEVLELLGWSDPA